MTSLVEWIRAGPSCAPHTILTRDRESGATIIAELAAASGRPLVGVTASSVDDFVDDVVEAVLGRRDLRKARATGELSVSLALLELARGPATIPQLDALRTGPSPAQTAEARRLARQILALRDADPKAPCDVRDLFDALRLHCRSIRDQTLSLALSPEVRLEMLEGIVASPDRLRELVRLGALPGRVAAVDLSDSRLSFWQRASVCALVKLFDVTRIERKQPDAQSLKSHLSGIHTRFSVVSSTAHAARVVRDLVIQHIECSDALPERIALITDTAEALQPHLARAFESPISTESIPLANSSPRHFAGLDALQALLELTASPFYPCETLDLLDNPAIHDACGLDPETAMRLKESAAKAGLRGYLDEPDRSAAAGLPLSDEGTWAATLDRLAAGMHSPLGRTYAVNASGIAPSPQLAPIDAPLLGALARFIAILGIVRQLGASRLGQDWIACATDLVNAVIPDSHAWANDLVRARRALGSIENEIHASGFTRPIDGRILIDAWNDQLKRRRTRRSAPLVGGVPVLTPAAARHRELDFAIFVLSSNFPSPSEPALDNLFPHGVAAGLPDPRQCQVEDAEAILARTRATAAFVTIGVDPRSAQPIPQSTFVARLESLLGSTTIREPFAAHDPRACAQRTPTRCRATLAAMKIAAAAAPAQRSITRDSGFEVPQEVDVWEFLDFFKNPHRAFFRARGLWIPEFEPPLPARAAEEPRYLDRSTVRRGIHGRLLELQKSGVAPILTKQMRDAHFAHICAEGFIAPSAAGREWFDAQASVMEDFTRRVRTGTTVVPIDLTVGYSLDGAARSLRIHGSAPCQNSTIVVERIGSATNEVLLSTVALEAVLAEAGLNLGWRVVCIESDAVKERTVGDRKFRTTPIPLDSLARLWAVGLRRPIPLFATVLRDHGRTNWASHDPRFIAWASEALHSPDGTERPTLDASARLLDAASIVSLTWDSAIDAPATTGLSDFERISRLFDAANTADNTIADSVR